MNKKYWFLTIPFLEEETKTKSMAQIAKEQAELHGCDARNLAGSIRFLVYKNFSKQKRASMVKERAFHRNRKKPRL